MRNITPKARLLLIILLNVFVLFACRKDRSEDPDITPLKDGFQLSSAIGYCASLANSLFRGEDLPPNVLFQSSNNSGYSGSGVMYVTINEDYPLPFNSNVGQIIIGCLWDEDYNNEYAGVITAVFTDISIIDSKYELKGIHTIPVSEQDDGRIMTVYAAQDIIMGEGSDTILDIGMSISNLHFNTEMDRVDQTQPTDAFVAVKQNVWFVNIDQNNTYDDIYDDDITINGGGQMAEGTDDGGGIQYHALIGVDYTYSNCSLNPTDGVGFIQNLKATTSTITGVDLGHIFINFHSDCDNKGFVEIATGKYILYNRKTVRLNFN